MIIKRKLYSHPEGKKIIRFIVKKADEAAVKSSKNAKKTGAKVISKSLEKSLTKRKIAEIKAKYPNNPEIAERKIKQLLSKKSGRIENYAKEAQKKLEAVNPTRKALTPEQISQKVENLTSLPTASQVRDSIGRAKESVVSGVSNLYNNTGKVATNAGALFYRAPMTATAQLAGTAINVVGAGAGHPEVLAVPFGTIASAPAAAVDLAMPRKFRRKLRQGAIKFTKKSQKSGFYNWSLKNHVNKSQEYSRYTGAPGFFGVGQVR